MEFYFDNVSQPCRSVYMLLHMNKIRHIEKPTKLFEGQTKTPEYLAVNPLGKVPAIKDGDFALAESNAILKYIATQKGAAEHWYPKDEKTQARVDEYLAFHAGNLRNKCSPYFFNLVVAPKVTKTPVDEEASERRKQEMLPILDMLESYFLAGRDFIAGKEISIADIQAISELMQVDMGTPCKVAAGRPNMAAWIERVKAKTAPHFDEAHKPLIQMLEKFSEKAGTGKANKKKAME